MARGTIIERGKDTYRIAVPLPPDPLTGERRRLFETFHGSKKKAEARLTELLSLADQQKLGADPKMTVGEFLDRWLQDYASAKAPKTFQRYSEIVKNQILPHLGNTHLAKLTPSHIVRLLAILHQSERRDRRQGPLSPQTILHVYRTLHAALECAVKWQLLPRNPADGVDVPSVPRKEMKTFTIEQAQTFLEASVREGAKWQAYFHLAVTAGLRSGELKGLRWQDVSLDAGSIAVQQNVQRVPGVGRVTRQPKTQSGRRPIALDVDTVALLRRYRAEQNAYRLQMGPLWQDHGLVFPSEVGTPLEDKRIRVVFFRVCDRAGLPRIRPYDLRHTSASLLLASGVHPKVVAERLGHSNVTLTLTTYSHVLPTLQQDAADTLGALLKPKPARAQ
ncbi:MAG: site-specific integrase [Chloroflexi bacterium]|nr:site-specific integrase [Chloroflexota bacterium]